MRCNGEETELNIVEIKRFKHQRRRGEQDNEKTTSLTAVVPGGVNRADEQSDSGEVELAMGSGATEAVFHDVMLQRVRTTDGSACRRGVQHEVASGTLLPNLGEKKLVGYTVDGATDGNHGASVRRT